MFKLFVLASALLIASGVQAKRFANGYIEFELPPGWNCVIEGSEWVCQSENKDRKKEAIIILAAKKRGDQDDIGKYQAYLKKTKTYQLPGAKMQRSEPKNVKTRMINGATWVDALHLASEVPGFYTRYLATVKADIGVAVTFSVTKSLYNAYKGIFDNVINSMRVFRQANKNPLAANLAKRKNKDDAFNDGVFDPGDDQIDIAQVGTEKRNSGSGDSDDLILFAIIGGVAGFALMKMKKKGGKKKGTSKKG